MREPKWWQSEEGGVETWIVMTVYVVLSIAAGTAFDWLQSLCWSCL